MLGENALAMEAYDQAIAQAQENDYISDLAVANELAASFWLQQIPYSLGFFAFCLTALLGFLPLA